MRSLLDEIIDSLPPGSGPDIVSEQHDINQISTEGMSSGGGKPSDRLRRQIAAISTGGWDASEYGITAAAQIAKLETALAEALAFERTPEGFALAAAAEVKVMAEMRARAIRRANLDTSNGRVNLMVAGPKPAWHKLGVQVADAVNGERAAELSGTGFKVGKQAMLYRNPVTGELSESKDVFAIVRQDTGAMLGNVGSRYQPIQNSDGFAMLDAVLGEFGAKYEAAGSLYGGRRVFMQVRLPNQCFTVGNRDRVEAFALFTNPHDGSTVAECFANSNRVECANTLRVARQGAKDKGLRLRHTGDIKGRVKDARQALGITVREFDRFAQNAEVLGRTPVPNIRHYASDVLDAVLEVTAADALKGANALAAALQVTEAERELAVKAFDRKIERRGEVLEDILSRYESERCGLNGQRGTAWAAMNAVTESADHGKLGGRFVGSENDKLSRRFESLLTGAADEAKQVAYVNALALAT